MKVVPSTDMGKTRKDQCWEEGRVGCSSGGIGLDGCEVSSDIQRER